MHLVRCSGRFRLSLLRCRHKVSGFSSLPGHPNPPLDLDSSLQALLKEDISLTHTRIGPSPSMKELEVMNVEKTAIVAQEERRHEDDLRRKSLAAHFGSYHIGAVVLPSELQASIDRLISESDRSQLHSDAKRLFYDGGSEAGLEGHWEVEYNTKYRSRRQAARHYERDGTAFVSVAFPAHYSAIVSVLDHLKLRLEATWKVERVIEWGAGTGSGIWASLHTFRNPLTTKDEYHTEKVSSSDSTITTYVGIDNREGLVAIGKCILRNIDLGNLSLAWHKSFQKDDVILTDGHDTLALSAFMLTTLPTAMARKKLVKEMWESGAHVMVLLDHNTPTGFEAIAGAREYLLNMGRKELADPEAVELSTQGSHVVAPCPHDSACPLHHPGSNRLVCGFTQRLQRPSFVRRTKHSGVGHEDIEYSYVVIRRGLRPAATMTNLGRIGEVGRRALDKEVPSQVSMKELTLHSEHEESIVDEVEQASISLAIKETELESRSELREALRLEAFSWPRLVFPPLKRSGHIILDGCTAEGKIMRMTIPKSQGKQPYYDARKSSWGDIFPHPPKNPPQERHQRVRRARSDISIAGEDIGKRRRSNRSKERANYEVLSKSIKDHRKRSRRDRLHDLAI